MWIRCENRRRSWASLPHRPPTSDASTTSRCGPGRASSGYRASLRRRATSIAAPSGLPSACTGDTSVTAQHSASPRLVAPYKTKSSRLACLLNAGHHDKRTTLCHRSLGNKIRCYLRVFGYFAHGPLSFCRLQIDRFFIAKK